MFVKKGEFAGVRATPYDKTWNSPVYLAEKYPIARGPVQAPQETVLSIKSALQH